MNKTTFLLASFIALVSVVPVNAQYSLTGVWEGGITIPGGTLEIIFKVEGEQGNYSGTIDIPQQGARNLRLSTVTQNADSATFTFSAGAVTGTFSGVFESESKISGTYTQGPGVTTFSIERTSESTTSNKPENEKDFVIKNGAVDIGGTLTIPDGEAKGPLVIMSSGSGAQDRDSNVFEFKIFAIIAQHLAKNGIPSFRYDDRSIGKSTGNFGNATIQDLTSDVTAIINFFENHDTHTYNEFITLGHSQGGVVAGSAARSSNAVKGVILVASMATSMKDILRYQVEFAYKQANLDAALIEEEIQAREQIMDAVANNSDLDGAKNAYIEVYRKVLDALPDSGIDKDQFANRNASQLVAIYNSPQTKSLLFYEPTDDIKELTVPALVLYGSKDTQVTIDQHKGITETALKAAGVPYEIKEFEGANHLFQAANTGLVPEYQTLPKEFVDGFLDSITQWILNNQ